MTITRWFFVGWFALAGCVEDAPSTACGNGVVEPGEACDDDSAGCAASCSCATGFAVRGDVCLDIDECATNNGGCGPSDAATCHNEVGAPPTCVPVEVIVVGRVAGSVRGLSAGASAQVVLGNDGYLATGVPGPGGAFEFADVPEGRYFLKVEVAGHAIPSTQTVVVEATTMRSGRTTEIDLEVQPLPADVFTYSWEEDSSRSGHQQTAYINTPPTIEFLDEPVETPDLAAAVTLRVDYHVLLGDDELPWTEEHAHRLLQVMRSVPQPTRNAQTAQHLRPSKWMLTSDDLADDVVVVRGEHGDEIRVSAKAFVYATPRMVLLDGERGTFFSKRLHRVVTRYVTADGTNLAAVERILTDRFGCSTAIPDHAALTATTTRESAASFQPFHPAELVELLNMFEEMPSGYHVVPGLRYLVRRKNGVPHPLYPEAPAVAWSNPALVAGDSYIELMESAFTTDPDHMHRLILHEKAHFLWGRLLSSTIKDEWIALGGWYADASPSGWSTTDTVGFVTPYAHARNPDEDLAESLSYFVLDPALLRSRALPKFEFIRDRIMHGTRYLSLIPSDLRFEVLNLFPDYTYPGKIVRVDVRAEGAPQDDKRITIELGLHTAANTFAGASGAYMRLFSEIGTFVDLYLQPVTAEGTVLRGELVISKHAKSGFWRPTQIVVSDVVGNQRLAGVNDYGWKLFVDNPLEDVVRPRFVPGSLVLEREDVVVAEHDVEHAVQRVRATWLVEDDGALAPDGVYAALSNAAGGYSLEAWGTATPGHSPGQFIATAAFDITEFRRSGEYGVPYIMMFDRAGNRGDQTFSASSQHQPLVSLPITTTNPDTAPPEVNLQDDPGMGLHRIRVQAAPTHPEAPDGETLVRITYQAKDDRSGVGVVSYRLLDPQGISHHQYHYHANFYSMFFDGDASVWADYQIDVVLPVGSPPGTWGLQELVLLDKAGNRRTYDFVETIRFDVAR